MPSVKFAPSVDEDRPSQKRRRDQDRDAGPETLGDSIEEKPPIAVKKYRPNEDELDDLDDWKQEDDEEDKNPGLPSEKELLEAKRQRRQNRNALDVDGKTKIDDLTSLAAEGIAIEPFHMRNEESDGTGFFDGDTYIFRRNNAEEGEDDEPDAWLDRLRDDEAEGKKSQYQVPVSKQNVGEAPLKESMDDLTNEQLYRKILPLLSQKESVSQALIRYGRLMKPARGTKALLPDASQSIAQSAAKEYLYELTGAANALLLKGEVEIYQATKIDIERHLPTTSPFQPSGGITQHLIEKQSPAKWEYEGKQDGAVHGPYTTEQMLAWVKAGYFVGAQRVKVRTIREERKAVSTQEDLLADLLDDDEDEKGDFNETVLKKGEWQWSNEVDFGAYSALPNC